MPNIDLSSMNDDDVSQLGIQPAASPATAAPKTAAAAPSSAPIDLSKVSDDQLSAMQPQVAPGQDSLWDKTKGTLRSAEQGLTFGAGDELNALARSKLGGEDYDKALADERAQLSQFRESHPYLSTGAEIAGALPTMFAPGLQELNGMRYLQEAKTAGQAALRSGLVGTGYGAVSGFGHGEGGLQNRAENAVTTGLESGAAGLPFGYLGYKVGEAVGGARAAKDEAGANGNIPQSALNVLARKFNADNIDPVKDIIENQMLPSGRALTKDQMQEIITSSNDGATQNALATKYGVGKGTIARIQNLFEQNTTTPMTMVDRAKMVRPGAGSNLEWRMRAAAATPGEARREAVENLTNRQLGQGSRLMEAAQAHLGEGTDDSIEAAQTALKNSENGIYGAARDVQKPFDLNPVLDDWNSKLATEFGPSDSTAAKIKQALNLFYDAKDVVNPMGISMTKRLDPVTNLGRFQNAKSQLDAMIAKAGQDGDKFLSSNLLSLKSDLMQPVRDTNPVWSEANDTFTGAGEKAVDAGNKTLLRMGSQYRKIDKLLSRYENQAADDNPAIAAAGQAQLDLYRQSLSRTIQDGLQNRGPTNDLARSLVTPAAQKIMARVYGDKAAGAFNRILQEEQAGTQTFNRIASGRQSQTAPLEKEIDAAQLPALISSFSDLKHPAQLLYRLGERAAGKLYANQNAALMKHMANTDPVEQMNALRSINTVAQGQQAAGQALSPRYAAFPITGIESQSEQQALSNQDNPMKRRGFAGGGIADDDSDQGGIMPYLADNPRGWKDAPPESPYQGEIRNQDSGGLGNLSPAQSLPYDLVGIPQMVGGIESAHRSAGMGDVPGELSGLKDTAVGASMAAAPNLSPGVAKQLGRGALAIGAGALGAAGLADTAEAYKARNQYRAKTAGSFPSPDSAPAAASAPNAPDPYADIQKIIGDDPQANALLARYKKLMDASQQDVGGPGYAKSKADVDRKGYRDDATKAYNDILARVDEMNAAHEPFEKRWHNAAQVLPWVTALGPVAAGAAFGANAKMMENLDRGAWQGAVNKAQAELQALREGNPSWWQFWKSKPDANAANDAIQNAAKFQEADKTPQTWGDWALKKSVPAGLGATMGFESRALPYQYNRSVTPPDSPEHKEADTYLSNPLNSVIPAAWGAVGGVSGSEFGHNFFPGKRAPNAETDVLKSYLSDDRAQNVANIIKNINAGKPDVGGGPPATPLLSSGPSGPGPRLSGPSSAVPALEPPGGLGSAPRLSGPSSTGTGSLGEQPATSEAAKEASRRIGSMGSAAPGVQASEPELPPSANDLDYDPDVPLWKQLGVHHSATQPKDSKNRFKGPPK